MAAVEAVKEAAVRLDPAFVVIPGVEFTSLRVHMNLIGVRTPMKTRSTTACTRRYSRRI
jgi:hypothetical protein